MLFPSPKSDPDDGEQLVVKVTPATSDALGENEMGAEGALPVVGTL